MTHPCVPLCVVQSAVGDRNNNPLSGIPKSYHALHGIVSNIRLCYDVPNLHLYFYDEHINFPLVAFRGGRSLSIGARQIDYDPVANYEVL
jgi:hypothetical protein